MAAAIDEEVLVVTVAVDHDERIGGRGRRCGHGRIDDHRLVGQRRCGHRIVTTHDVHPPAGVIGRTGHENRRGRYLVQGDECARCRCEDVTSRAVA